MSPPTCSGREHTIQTTNFYNYAKRRKRQAISILNGRSGHLLFGHVHTNKNGKRGCDSERVRSMCTATMYDVGVDFNDFTPIRFQDVKAQIARQKKLRMNFIELYEYDNSSRLKQFFLRLRKRLFK